MRLTATLLLATMLAMPVHAQTTKVQSSEPIEVISGGVGEDERGEFETKKEDFSLKLVFVGEKGLFLSNVKVVVEDKRGNTLLTATSDGPYLYANLPAGKYKLTASLREHTQEKNIATNDKGQRAYYFRFPIKDEEPVLVTPAPPPASAPDELIPPGQQRLP